MFVGVVRYRNKVGGQNPIMFADFAFKPADPKVERIELHCPDGKAVMSTISVISVAGEDEGLAVAGKANIAAMDRLAYLHNIPIGVSEIGLHKFVWVDAGSAMIALGDSEATFRSGLGAAVATEVSVDELIRWLEQRPIAGERFFGLFHSAMRSTGPAEQFLTLYAVLALIHNNNRRKIEAFIRQEEPAVKKRYDERKKKDDTVYTYLRDDFAHIRPGLDLEATRSEMGANLKGLIALVKRAIENAP